MFFLLTGANRNHFGGLPSVSFWDLFLAAGAWSLGHVAGAPGALGMYWAEGLDLMLGILRVGLGDSDLEQGGLRFGSLAWGLGFCCVGGFKLRTISNVSSSVRDIWLGRLLIVKIT